MKAVVIALAFVACVAARDAENFGHPPCSTLDDHCAHVFMCAAGSSNPLGHVETCVPDDEPVWDAEETYGEPCIPTPRHEGTCIWGCKDDGWFFKCNSFDDCFGCKASER